MERGRIPDRVIDLALRKAFEGTKPIGGIYLGIFPGVRDALRKNAGIAHRILIRD